MRLTGIFGVAPKPHLSTLNPEHVIYPYLLVDVSASLANHVWGIEEVYLTEDDSGRAAIHRLTYSLDYSNHWRPHQLLGYQAPADVYFGERVTDGGNLSSSRA